MIHGGVERMFKTKEEYDAHMLGVVKNLGGREATMAAIESFGAAKGRIVARQTLCLERSILRSYQRKLLPILT